MKHIKIGLLLMVMLLVVNMVSAEIGNFFFTCDVGGATIETYEDNTYTDAGACPLLLERPAYTYVIVRVSAPGFITFERGYENVNDGLNHFNITLVAEDYVPDGRPMFGFGGKIVSRRGFAVFTGQYQVIIRNLTTYKKGDGQTSEDRNSNTTDGWYSAALVNFATNKAVKVGDRVVVVVANSNFTRMYGCKVFTITTEDIEKGDKITTILVP